MDVTADSALPRRPELLRAQQPMDAPHPLQMVMQLLLSPKTPPMLQLQQAPSARGHSLISDGALEPEDLGSDNRVGSVGRLKAIKSQCLGLFTSLHIEETVLPWVDKHNNINCDMMTVVLVMYCW